MMQVFLGLICCVLAYATAACGAQPTAGKLGNDIDFPALVKIADRYGVPFPPDEAPLVLANSGWTSMLGSSSTSHDPGVYLPAFLLERLPQNRIRVLIGWETKVVSADVDFRPATRPYSLVSPEPKLKGYVLQCNNMSSFITAVQLARRGAMDDAGKLWGQIKASSYFDTQNSHEGLGDLRAKPRILLALCIYQYFYDLTLTENADLKSIYAKLLLLQTEFPAQFLDIPKSSRSSPKNYHSYRRSHFVHDLGLTVRAKTAPAGSVEALLIDWGNRTSKYRHLGYFDEHNVESDRPAREIFLLGLKAIPDLAKLVDDQRLTRHVSPAFMMKPEERVRLGELAKQLLAEISGARDPKAALPAGNDADAERKCFEEAAVQRIRARITGFCDVALWILGEKYPQSLLAICSMIPAQATTDAPLFKVAGAIARSKLAKPNKTEALAGLCGRLQDYRRKRTVLQELAKLDEGRTVTLLRPILAQLPKDVNEPYWTCEAAAYTHVVMQLHDGEIWNEYLKVAKQAAVGLRMEIMEPMDYTYIGDTNRQRRLAFLAAFLDDTALRDMTVDGNKYDGPCAAFTIQKIEVRDFAAMEIACVLDFEEQPDEFWTKAQWAQLRSRVRAALEKLKLPK